MKLKIIPTWQKILILLFLFSFVVVVVIYFFIQGFLNNINNENFIQSQRTEYENEQQ